MGFLLEYSNNPLIFCSVVNLAISISVCIARVNALNISQK